MRPFRRRRLLRALSSRDQTTRWGAAKALLELRDERTVRRLQRLLGAGGDEAARAAAAYVLGFSGESEVAPALAERLADQDESVVVRSYAAEALGHLLQEQTVLAGVRTPIVRALRDASPDVRFWSAFAAGVLGLQESRPQLERLAAGDHETIEGWWSVAEEARWALRLLDGEEDPPLPSARPAASEV